jgi:hypothetical protein
VYEYVQCVFVSAFQKFGHCPICNFFLM